MPITRFEVRVIRIAKLVIVATTMGAWGVSFLLFENACYENCELSTVAQVLRWATLGAASIAAYAAYRVAVTERRAERRQGVTIVAGALAAWAVLLGACLLALAGSSS